jgi:MFS family permease
LAIPDARALIAASGASEIGDWLYNAALLGYVFSATKSAAWVGAATICRLLPYILFSPIAGAVVDRYPRRTVLLAGDALRLLLMAVLAAVVASDGPVAVVIAIAALSSAAGSADKPAALALLPRLVGESRLGPANALLHTVQDMGIVIGPAIGAILLAVAPAYVAFVANGATFGVAAVLISTMRPRDVPVGARRGAIADITDGLRTARVTSFVLPLFLIVAMVELTYGAQTVQLVVYARRSLGLGTGGYSVLLAAAGVGGLLSALANGQLATSRRVSLVVVGAGALACATQLAYAGVDTFAIAFPVTVIGGAGLVSCEVVSETALARIVPRAVLGRVAGVFQTTSVIAMVTGAVLASILVQSTSLSESLLILGAGALLVTFACAFGLRGLDAVSRRRAEALASRLAVVEGLPVVAGVPRLVLEQLASASQLCPLPPGVDVVVQGAPAHAFYAVVDGRVVVHRNGAAVAHLGPGDSFGERGLLDRAPRNATVTTEIDTTVLRVEGDALLEALQAAPALIPALERSSTAPGIAVPAAETAVIDDRRWVDA